MTTSREQALGEGNCARVTERGEEACECVRKYRPELAADHILTKSARLRTETSYQAGSVRRVSQTSRSRPPSIDQVKDELVQRKLMLLSGETCIDRMRAIVAPGSKSSRRLKAWNRLAKASLGGAGVSSVAVGGRDALQEMTSLPIGKEITIGVFWAASTYFGTFFELPGADPYAAVV